ncbi:MAG: Spy/CpxP family protein refolding chaperone [Betaproteobacteria bacterium]|nr:Spy/CpxP family protein refolding chaperone [Betaproteobacteria bacterium]
MNKRAALAALLAAATAPALAQMGGRRRGGMGKGGDQSGNDGPKDKGGGAPRVNLLETTAHELHEDLKLTPVQEPLWDTYLEKVRLLGNDVVRERVQQPSGRTVTQQIDRIVDTARNRLAALEDIAQAAKDLYAKLTPEQQPTANPRLANLMLMPLAPQGGGSPRG